MTSIKVRSIKVGSIRAGRAMLLVAGLLPAALLPSACGGIAPPPDTAAVTRQAFGAYQDDDVGAMSLVEYDFSDASRTYGKPAEAAKALAALDYIAGQLSTGGRWTTVTAAAKLQMLQARVTARTMMGISLQASSQEVVDDLLAASAAFAANDPGKAAAALPAPIFPPDIVARLSNMPYMQTVNAATMEAGNEMMVGLPNVAAPQQER